MSSIIISPDSEEEAQFILALLNRLQIAAITLTEEEKEDLGLGLLMKEADRSRKVPKDEIIEKRSN